LRQSLRGAGGFFYRLQRLGDLIQGRGARVFISRRGFKNGLKLIPIALG
jgi:hypothetical protein